MNNSSGGGRGPRESRKDGTLDLDGLDSAAQANAAPLRAIRGISPSMDPEQERAAQQVSVPKAPLVPHDIERMPNRELPRWSARPGFSDEDEPEEGARSRRHTDADLPPPIRFEPEDAAPADSEAPSAAAASTPAVSVPSRPQGVARGARTAKLVIAAAVIVLAVLFVLLR